MRKFSWALRPAACARAFGREEQASDPALLGLLMQVIRRLHRLGKLVVAGSTVVFVGRATFILYSFLNQGGDQTTLGFVVWTISLASLLGAWWPLLARARPAA
jgi:hypothetical protein